MKKILLILLLSPIFVNAQFFNGPTVDSSTFNFAATDSFVHYLPSVYGPISKLFVDTTGATLWQVGSTAKPVFSNGTTEVHGIMTDTLHPYPANANDFFVLKMYQSINCIINLWHKYQTDSLHAGGIIEFSTDSASWINIADCFGIQTENFYTSTDTLISGQPAFTGTSNGEQLSRFQLINCVGVKTTTTTCFPDYNFGAPIYIRFRFVSDSTTDSLSGWMIDSIRVDYTICTGSVGNTSSTTKLTLFPNPATTTLTITAPNKITNIIITNLIGQTVYIHEYDTEEVQVDVADLPTGLYFVKINETEVRRFMKE